MSNNKQSSIDYLIRQKELFGVLINDDFKIAKAMYEKEIEKTIDMSRNLCKISDIDGYDEYQFTKEEILEKILKVTENEQQ